VVSRGDRQPRRDDGGALIAAAAALDRDRPAPMSDGGRVLSGRVALVVGASRGIGAATGRALADAGAAVVLAARDQTRLDAAAAEIRRAGGQALAVATDVTDEVAVARLADRVLDAHGRLDAAVNCVAAAAGGRRPTALADLSLADLDTELAVTLRGVLVCLQHEIRAMTASGGGSIVTVASTASTVPVAGVAG